MAEARPASSIFERAETPRPRVVTVPNRPLSLWVRLAHVHGPTGAWGSVRSQLRVNSDFVLILQLDGLSWIWSEDDGGSFDVPAGSIGFIPPGFVNAWGSEGGRHIAVHFDLHARPEIGVPANMRFLGRTVSRRPLTTPVRFALQHAGTETTSMTIPLVTEVPSPQAWREQLDILVDLWNRRTIGTLDSAVRATQVLGSVLQNLVEPGPGAEAADVRIARLVGRLDDVGATRASVADLARSAGMGETSFRAAFNRTIGVPPRRYLEERRIEHAARYLAETDLSIAQISEAVGYDDPYHFSRVFRRVKGISPRQYRTRVHRLEASAPKDPSRRIGPFSPSSAMASLDSHRHLDDPKEDDEHDRSARRGRS
jgi:AraC-like DNA-binding protein